MENIMTAEEYFEMATANTKETRLQVCAEECIALMNDFAEQLPESGEAGVGWINAEYVIEAIKGHDTTLLRCKIALLKGMDGESWAIGEMLERAIQYLEK